MAENLELEALSPGIAALRCGDPAHMPGG